MKKLTAMLLAVFTAVFCCSSCSKQGNESSEGNAPDVSAEDVSPEATNETQPEEDTTAEATENTTEEKTEEKTTIETTTEETTEPREGAAPFGDFYDVGYCGDAVRDSSSETLLISAGGESFSFNYAEKLNAEKRIRLAEFFNRCSYPDYTSGSGGNAPWLKNNSESSINFMVKNGKELRFLAFSKDTACLTYIRSAYTEDSSGAVTSVICSDPEIHKYNINYDYMESNIAEILGIETVSSSESFSLLDDSDLYFNFSPYYHPENMTLYPENGDDKFGAFSIPNYAAFKLEKNTAAAVKILNSRTYTKITNPAEIPAQNTAAAIEKCYKLGGNPSVTPKSDRTFDQVIIMCNSDNGYYIINIVSGQNAVVSCARYQFRTEGDRKICTNMDEVKSGHNIEWYRCSGDLAGEIRNAVSPELS